MPTVSATEQSNVIFMYMPTDIRNLQPSYSLPTKILRIFNIMRKVCVKAHKSS